MSRRRRHLDAEPASTASVTDPDLVALVPRYGPEGRAILELLQTGRDRRRTEARPMSQEARADHDAVDKTADILGGD